MSFFKQKGESDNCNDCVNICCYVTICCIPVVGPLLACVCFFGKTIGEGLSRQGHQWPDKDDGEQKIKNPLIPE